MPSPNHGLSSPAWRRRTELSRRCGPSIANWWTEVGVAHILTPPFDKTEPSPGYIQGYPPGIRENGGQYTHGVIWSIIAWCRLGDGDKAFELFHMFNPIMHTKTSAEVRKYVGEPYAMAADVYTEAPHRGHAGWTWYTGASVGCIRRASNGFLACAAEGNGCSFGRAYLLSGRNSPSLTNISARIIGSMSTIRRTNPADRVNYRSMGRKSILATPWPRTDRSSDCRMIIWCTRLF